MSMLCPVGNNSQSARSLGFSLINNAVPFSNNGVFVWERVRTLKRCSSRNRKSLYSRRCWYCGPPHINERELLSIQLLSNYWIKAILIKSTNKSAGLTKRNQFKWVKIIINVKFRPGKPAVFLLSLLFLYLEWTELNSLSYTRLQIPAEAECDVVSNSAPLVTQLHKYSIVGLP